MEVIEIMSWIATALSLTYVFLAARSSIWCWIFAILGSSIWAYVSYTGQLYSDAGLQVFYVLMAIVGWFNWQNGKKGAGKLIPIKRMSVQEHLLVWGIGLPLGYLLGRYLGDEWGAVATYWDAYTTVFSVIITFAVISRRLENWLYWIVIDMVTGALYYSRELYAFCLVMVVYTLVAVIGYIDWRKEVERSTIPTTQAN